MNLASRFLVPVRRGDRGLSLFVGIAMVVMMLPACSGVSGFKDTKRERAPDFKIGSYTTAGLLAEGESSFSQVLALNQPVVLNFWGGDCAPCREEMPDFQRVADEYQGRAIILGIDVGAFTSLGTHASAEQLLTDLKITYPTGYAIDDAPVRDYNLPGLPMTVLINKDHDIVLTKIGLYSETELRSDVKKLVAD